MKTRPEEDVQWTWNQPRAVMAWGVKLCLGGVYTLKEGNIFNDSIQQIYWDFCGVGLGLGPKWDLDPNSKLGLSHLLSKWSSPLMSISQQAVSPPESSLATFVTVNSTVSSLQRSTFHCVGRLLRLRLAYTISCSAVSEETEDRRDWGEGS